MKKNEKSDSYIDDLEYSNLLSTVGENVETDGKGRHFAAPFILWLIAVYIVPAVSEGVDAYWFVIWMLKWKVYAVLLFAISFIYGCLPLTRGRNIISYGFGMVLTMLPMIFLLVEEEFLGFILTAWGIVFGIAAGGMFLGLSAGIIYRKINES